MTKAEIIVPEDRAHVEEVVKTGVFANASAVAVAALHVLHEQ